MSKRKHAEIIRAWLDGKTIEWQHPTGLYWSELDESGYSYEPENPMTYENLEWRVKVEDEKSKSVVGDKDYWIDRMDE